MTDAPVAVAAATPKKKTAAKPKKVATHPPTAQMVNAAIKALKDRKGSSLQAIKKYIGTTYKVDADKLAPFIRKYLISAQATGKVILTKGKGAAGSFKLPAKEEKPKVKKAPKAKKPKAAAKPKKPKTPKAKKPAAKKPKATKSPKAKKAAKPPTKKPKAPKPKKAATKKSPAKKAAPKKK